jgi:hypothetical protein
MLYERGSCELSFYDEHGNFVQSYYSKTGVRQGYVLGAFLFCLAMAPVYARIGSLFGPDGALHAYSDDGYLLADPVHMAIALDAAPSIYKKVGLRIGWGPCKTEMILPPDVDSDSFLSLVGPDCHPFIVTGFTSCLGVPRHATNDHVFTSTTLESLGERHDRLLDLIEEVADVDPFAALRLLQVCNVNRFSHTISSVPPPLVHDFAIARDEAVAATVAAIKQETPSESSTHSLLVGAGGASITSPAKHTTGSYPGAFFRVTGPLHQRLIAMGGSTNRSFFALLAELEAASSLALLSSGLPT